MCAARCGAELARCLDAAGSIAKCYRSIAIDYRSQADSGAKPISFTYAPIKIT